MASRDIEIVQDGNTVLRRTAKEVPIDEIKSSYIKEVISVMKNKLKNESDGVGLAAPQIGESLRIFIVSGRAFDIVEGTFEEGKKTKESDMVFINPVMTKLSKTQKEVDEGCLSVRWKYGKIKRSLKATLEALDENGKKFSYGGSGLIAQIFQHELDHLNGILFIDKAKDIQDLPPPKK